MATRTMDNQQDRLLTISMIPFMSCSARLPVYTLFASLFFPHNTHNIVFSMYIIGILAATLTGYLLKKQLLHNSCTPTVMELGNYHMPSFSWAIKSAWGRLKSFILKAGKLIILVVVVLNLLNSVGTDGTFKNENSSESILCKFSQMITPIFAPMGIQKENWPATVGIFTGILAKEAVIGTLNALYSQLANPNDSEMVATTSFNFINELTAVFIELYNELITGIYNLAGFKFLQSEEHLENSAQGMIKSMFTSNAAVIAYLLFILLYTPCITVIGTIYKETNLKWALFISTWTFFLGYAVATAYYQLTKILIQPSVTLFWLCTLSLIMAGFIKYMKSINIDSGKLKNQPVATPFKLVQNYEVHLKQPKIFSEQPFKELNDAH